MEARLFQYPIHLVTKEQAVQRIEQAIHARDILHVVTLNPEMIMQAELDRDLAIILHTVGLVIPDGTGVVWALRRKGYKNAKRLPGIELSEAVLASAAEKGLRVAFIGANPDVLDKALANLKERYPGLNIVFQHHGYFDSDRHEADIAQACVNQQPDIIFVALGVPRQEKWIRRFSRSFPGGVFIGVGGSLDVWSGVKKRAPAFFLRTNLEWLYRITSEPWRIRRTYKTLPRFVVKVLFTKS